MVLWNLDSKGEDRQTVLEKIRKEFTSLEGKIGEIISISVVENLNLEDSDKKDLSLIVDLDSMEDLRIYADHKEHLDVVERLKKYLKDRTIIDFEIGD